MGLWEKEFALDIREMKEMIKIKNRLANGFLYI